MGVRFMITHIVACDQNGGIGLNGVMPWHLPNELQHFKNETLGKACLVGRTTAEKMPKLPRRVVLTVSSANPLDKCLSESQAFCDALNSDDIMIIGGAKLYASTTDIVERVILTRIHQKFECDTFYQLPDGMRLIRQSERHADINRTTGLIESYSVEVWER